MSCVAAQRCHCALGERTVLAQELTELPAPGGGAAPHYQAGCDRQDAPPVAGRPVWEPRACVLAAQPVVAVSIRLGAVEVLRAVSLIGDRRPTGRPCAAVPQGCWRVVRVDGVAAEHLADAGSMSGYPGLEASPRTIRSGAKPQKIRRRGLACHRGPISRCRDRCGIRSRVKCPAPGLRHILPAIAACGRAVGGMPDTGLGSGHVVAPGEPPVRILGYLEGRQFAGGAGSGRQSRLAR
jgi:hypothetical protein